MKAFNCAITPSIVLAIWLTSHFFYVNLSNIPRKPGMMAGLGYGSLFIFIQTDPIFNGFGMSHTQISAVPKKRNPRETYLPPRNLRKTLRGRTGPNRYNLSKTNFDVSLVFPIWLLLPLSFIPALVITINSRARRSGS